MLIRFIAAVAVFLTVALPQAQAALDKKVALVVGNAAYDNAPPLTNSVADAKAMSAAFERLGFEVVYGYDLDLPSFNSKIREFRLKAKDADLTAFFYAGHALQAAGQNYLVPTDALFQDDAALDFEAVKVDFVMRQMRNRDGVSLVFLDACRDNPLARSLGPQTRSTVGRGLAQMDITNAGKGLAIAFATAPGEVAYDGKGTNSPFTTALINHIESEDTDITQVMSRVTGEVLKSTDERQRPWLNMSLTGPVVLKPKPAVATPATTAPVLQASLPSAATVDVLPDAASQPPAAVPDHNIAADKAFFDTARAADDIDFYQAYIAKFPRGLFVELARARVLELREARERASEVAAISPDATPKTAAPETAAAETAAVETKRTTPPIAPAFVVTDEMRAVIGTEVTEQALAMNRTKRREVQARLNLVEGIDVGGADGIFGRKTRIGLIEWQGRNGFTATGFLAAPQLMALEAETREVYAAYQKHQATIRKRSSAKKRTTRSYSKKKRSSKRRTAKRRSTRRNNNSAANAAAGAFFGGVVGGIIGGAMR